MSWWKTRGSDKRDSVATEEVSLEPASSPAPEGGGRYRRESLRERKDGSLLLEIAEERRLTTPAGRDLPFPKDRIGLVRVVLYAWMVAFGLVGAGSALAQETLSPSLWSDREGFRFTNRKAMAVGDLLTVIVVESASGRNRSSLSTSKEHKLEVGGGPGAGPFDFIPLFNLESETKDELSGDGSVSLSGELQTTITVEVIEIRPNGQLVIEGTRTLTLNKEEDKISLHGVARPEDILSDNTILSTKLAEVQIAYEGKGATKRATRPGIFQRLFGWIF